MIQLARIKQAFLDNGAPLGDLEDIFRILDFDQDGQIIYSQFLAATVDKKSTLTMQNLWFAFHHFDVENKGVIDESSLMEVFRR